MKIIFPSFALFAATAAIACAQTDPRVPAMPAGVPPAATSSAENGGVTGLAPAAPNALQPGTSANNANALAQDAPADSAEIFMQRVDAAADQLKSVQARIRYRTNMFGVQNVGTGVYLQQGSGEQRQFRLELKTAIGQPGAGQKLLIFQQVCDGKFLWQYRDSFDNSPDNGPNANKQADNSPDRPTISRVDLTKVRQTLQDSEQRPNLAAINNLTIGGLPKLVDGLQQAFRFNRVEAGQLENFPVWLAVGVWRPKALEPLSQELAQQAAADRPLNLKLLPPQLPEQVWMYVGQDDLFPYRIEFRRRADGQGRGGNDPSDMRVVVTVEFYEVRLNTPISPREFEYQPSSADIVDVTAAFLKDLKGK
jgi:hypothetical protein